MKKIIENGEIEFKQNPNAAMFKTLSAFTNTEGGFVMIGVSDSGEVTGCRCLNSDLKELSDTIGNSLGRVLPQIIVLMILFRRLYDFFLGLAIRAGRLSAADDLEPAYVVLTRLGLITNGKLNNSGYLLFGKRQSSYSSEYVLRGGRFRDPTTITGNRWIG